jgi:hypothetical protein
MSHSKLSANVEWPGTCQVPTKESKMGAPSPELYNLWQDFHRETKRLELPAVAVIAGSWSESRGEQNTFLMDLPPARL